MIKSSGLLDILYQLITVLKLYPWCSFGQIYFPTQVSHPCLCTATGTNREKKHPQAIPLCVMGQFFKIAIGETICSHSASLGYSLVLVCLSMDGFTGRSHWNRASLEKGLKQKHGDMKLKIGLSGAVAFFVEGISSCTKFLLIILLRSEYTCGFGPWKFENQTGFHSLLKHLQLWFNLELQWFFYAPWWCRCR